VNIIISPSAIKCLELLTIIFGLFCVGISIVLSYRFKRIKLALSRALAFQLIGEAMVGLVTVIFAITSWLNLYSHLSPEIVLVMRFVIFGTASATSINLYKKVKQVENEKQ